MAVTHHTKSEKDLLVRTDDIVELREKFLDFPAGVYKVFSYSYTSFALVYENIEYVFKQPLHDLVQFNKRFKRVNFISQEGLHIDNTA